MEDQSYNLNGVVVREYQGKKFLLTAKENTIIEKIDDIGVVEEEESENDGISPIEDDGRPVKMDNVHVVGVSLLESYSGCLKYSGKVTVGDDDDSTIGSFIKCNLMQCMQA